MFRRREKGQSLIEVTFFLIILLILVAGIVEVGAILQTKLTVVNSAREGTRFGTVGASDADITLVTQTSASNVINFNEDNAEIWIIRAKTDASGNISDVCPANIADAESDDSYWCVNHEVGDGPEEPTFLTYEMVSNADDGLLYGIRDTAYIAVALSYDHQSIIGLPYAVGGGGMPVSSYTVMKMDETTESAGCKIWPIAVHKDKVNWDGGGLGSGAAMDDIAIGGGNGNFGWLRWNDSPGSGSQTELVRRLTDPSTSLSEFTNAANPDDHKISVGDWVYGDTGWVASNNVRQTLEDFQGEYIRILIYDVTGDDSTDPESGTCHGSNCSYHVIGFAIITVSDVDGDGELMNPPGSVGDGNEQHSIEGTFIEFDESCK